MVEFYGGVLGGVYMGTVHVDRKVKDSTYIMSVYPWVE